MNTPPSLFQFLAMEAGGLMDIFGLIEKEVDVRDISG